jgi:hypothetical protein
MWGTWQREPGPRRLQHHKDNHRERDHHKQVRGERAQHKRVGEPLHTGSVTRRCKKLRGSTPASRVSGELSSHASPTQTPGLDAWDGGRRSGYSITSSTTASASTRRRYAASESSITAPANCCIRRLAQENCSVKQTPSRMSDGVIFARCWIVQ